MSRYQTILWDVDGTLLDFARSERYAITVCFEKYGLLITEKIIERYSAINNSYWKRLETGEIANKQEVLLGRFETLFEEFSITTVSAEVFQNDYKQALGSVYYYLDDSLELCKKLKETYRQYIVTNGVSDTQEKKLRAAGFYEVMEDVFISEQIGIPKPQAGFFDYCFAKIGEVDKETTMIIGDSLSSDMKGGAMAGIATCWYNPNKDSNETGLEVTYEIRHLKEIVAILEGYRIKAIPEAQLRESGALLFANITSGLDTYESLLLPGTYTDFEYFLTGLLEQNGEGHSFCDFYYSAVSEEARIMIRSILTTEEITLLEQIDTTAGTIYYPLTKELLPLLLKLTTREMLFSTFYFTKYPCTLWGNYDMQYPILFLNEEVRNYYEPLIRQIF